MRINSVDFPDSLFKAQKDGSLVVFAGAGVSIPSPSNLPDFNLLAEQVAAGVLSREKDEPVDRFLGRLKDNGVEVHEKVRRILSDRTSKPNGLHVDLLRLFEEPDKFRLVTTNFDLHFTSAGVERFPALDNLEIYSAPALPLGSSFSGIVYLHGSVAKPANRLVLTDSDFGMAYLTQAWATRFLQQLFDHYLVLFIGYSHNDTVLDYLARGLPPKSKGPGRFALTLEGTEPHWKRLGINPITYPEGAINAKHAALAPALNGWVDRVRTSVLDHEERIKRIVDKPVPLDPEELDYIESVCKDKTLAQFFVRHCRTPDWLRWIEAKGFLSNLFKGSSAPTEIDQLLARWFAQWFACPRSDDALAVLQRQGGFIAPFLWDQIALSFHQVAPDHDAVAKWVPLLVSSQPQYGSRELLAYRLSTCQLPGDEQTILILFDHLTRLRVRLRKGFSLVDDEDENAEPEVFIEGSEHWLRQAWAKLFEPNLEVLADRVLIMLTSNIQQAYWIMRSFRKEESRWDPISGPRAEIESTAFGGSHEKTGVLIDMARDVLHWTITHRPQTSDSMIRFWFSSGCRLLERLAIFGVAESDHWSPNEKLRWLLENNLLHTYGFKPEVFLVLQRAYAPASEPKRAAVLEGALKGSDKLEGRTKEYEIFNLLFWLAKNAPDCALTKKQFADFSASHPSFGPREHPNLDWWIGGVEWVGPKSPLTLEDIVVTSPEKLISELANANVDDFSATNRQGLLNEISRAVTGNFEWSVQFAEALNKNKHWDPDLWRALVTGWKNIDLVEAQWLQVLTILRQSQPILGSLAYEASELLEKGINKTTHRIPMVHLPLSVALGEMLWDAVVASREEKPPDHHTEDWVHLAINHPAGALLTFRLRTLSLLREAAGENWTGIPQGEKSFLESVLAGASYAAGIARVLIASEVYFLFNLDHAWTVSNVIPLFDLAGDELRAIQAWHGFLAWGRWTEGFLPHLLPCFEQCFPSLNVKLGKEQRESFCHFLAGIACHASTNPLESGWLNRFLQGVTAEERIMWSSSMSATLKQMKDPLPENSWHGWISTYWQNRLDGVPMPLEVGEITEMVEWTLAFNVSFPEVTKKIYKSPIPKAKHDFFYTELSESEVLKLHPRSSATLFLYLLKIDFTPIYWFDPLIKIVEHLKGLEDTKEVLRQICGELARLGYADAGNLRDSI
jgi:hypothetical protein